MHLLEAINKYKETKDKNALYESLLGTVKYDEAQEILADVMGTDFTEDEYDDFIDEKMAEDFRRIGTREVFAEEI